MYQDTLNKLVTPILEEANWNNILVHQDGAHPYFGIQARLLGTKVSAELHWKM
jgi:hypothetical protein